MLRGTRVVKLAGHLAANANALIPHRKLGLLSSRRRVKINRVTLIYILWKRLKSLALIQESRKWRAFHSFLKGWVCLLFIFIEHKRRLLHAESAERGHNKRLCELCKDEEDAVNKLIWRASSRVDLSSSSHSWCSPGENDWRTFFFLGSRFKIRSPFKSSSIRERLTKKYIIK